MLTFAFAAASLGSYLCGRQKDDYHHNPSVTSRLLRATLPEALSIFEQYGRRQRHLPYNESVCPVVWMCGQQTGAHMIITQQRACIQKFTNMYPDVAFFLRLFPRELYSRSSCACISTFRALARHTRSHSPKTSFLILRCQQPWSVPRPVPSGRSLSSLRPAYDSMPAPACCCESVGAGTHPRCLRSQQQSRRLLILRLSD